MTPFPEQLIATARRETDKGLGPLLDVYRGYLDLLARVEVGPKLQRKLDPSDLVQETMLDACRQFALFKGTTEAQFLAWLRCLLAGKAANLVRHYLGTQARNLRRELEDALSESFDRATQRLSLLAGRTGNSPSQSCIRREQSVLIADALLQLADDERTIILLRHWEDRSFPEIARQLGKSVDSVEKRWLRSLGKLKNLVQQGAR